MTKQKHCHIFTSESVSEGHPDKVADQISDAILVACETMVGPDVVVNMGEITCRDFNRIDAHSIAKRVVKKIGYDVPEEHFSWDTFKYVSHLHGQSPDIAQGVNRKSKVHQGAGDQGMMFGYATNETRGYMPTANVYSHSLLKMFARLRHNGELAWLRPDAKSQISVLYENGKPVAIDTVVISHQTTAKGATQKHYDQIKELARGFLKSTGLLTGKTKFMINPTGKFVVGGPCGDSGLTGRKIIVDTYGGMAAHGGGAFSGKDPSKVDRSACYAARYVAKNIVASGIAEKCTIELSYAIGIAEPVSIMIDTMGTSEVPAKVLEKAVRDIFDLTPRGIIKMLDLKKPQYLKTASYGHFGRDEFSWEKLDKVELIKKACK